MQKANADSDRLLQARLGDREYLAQAQQMAAQMATLQIPAMTTDAKGNQVPETDADGNPVMNSVLDPQTFQEVLGVFTSKLPSLTEGLPGQPAAPASPAAPGGGQPAYAPGQSPDDRRVSARRSMDQETLGQAAMQVGPPPDTDGDGKRDIQDVHASMDMMMRLDQIEERQGPAAREAAESEMRRSDPEGYTYAKAVYDNYVKAIENRAKESAERAARIRLAETLQPGLRVWSSAARAVRDFRSGADAAGASATQDFRRSYAR
jgi:hypothetical protein